MSEVTIKKVKTTRDHSWDLAIRGTVIGAATATYKSPTQRFWTGHIAVPVVGSDVVFVAEYDCSKQDGNSVKSIIAAFTQAIADANFEVDIAEPAKPERKKRSKFPAKIKRDQVTPENAIEMSVHYGYGVDKKGGVQRTGVEQAKYLRQMLDRQAKATATAAIPTMAALINEPKIGEADASSMMEHYADA